MSDIFNEVGSPIGTKTIAILNSSNIVINTMVFNENESNENIHEFLLSYPEYSSFTIITNLRQTVGWEFTNGEWIEPELVLPPEQIAVTPYNSPELIAQEMEKLRALDELDGIADQ